MSRIRVPRLLSASLSLMLLISCTNPQMVCGCSPSVPAALLYGRVTMPDGEGAGGARVVAEVGGAGCVAPFHPAGQVDAQADGHYRGYIHGGIPNLPGGNCVRVRAEPGPASTLAASDTMEVELAFAGVEVPDSAQVNLVLRAP